MKKIRFTLGKKIVVMILAMSIILSATALFVSYRTYQRRTMAFYEQLGHNVVATLASQLDPDDLDRYYETLEMDEQYYVIQQFIFDLVDNNDVEYLYVVRPHGTGVTFLFDSDMEKGENGDYLSGGYCALGTYTELLGGFAENVDKLLEGEELPPIVQPDPSYGWLMTAMTPVLHEDGSLAGYVMADISMSDVVKEQQRYLLYCGGLLAAITVGFAAVYLLLIRRYFIRPIQELTVAAQNYEGGGNQKSFSRVKIRSNDELRTLADAFRMMLVEIDLNNLEQKELALREQKLESELQLANQLNVSMLPKELPERSGGYPFAIRGRVDQGKELSCCFYDYFLLDRERLCILVGEVPGGGIPQVLYTAMAQATIKSQMRSGLPLAEAMTVVNQQLHEMSGELSLNVLVGVLDGTTGYFSCINAGQSDPLLMRGQDQYQWVGALPYAPMGQNEHVVYQTMELELRQGDRILFHTAGLDAIQGQDGKTFADEQLRLSLNERQSRMADLDQQLQGISDASKLYAERPDQIGGYALLALEYRRRDRAQAHCVLTPDSAGSARLTAFLRGQLEANQIQGAQMAKMLVLADELFTLCCRHADSDSHMMAECAIPKGDAQAILRLKGSFRGCNPLENPQEEAVKHAAEFITGNCDRVLFESDETMDTVTVVKRLEKAEASESEKRI